MQPIGRKSYVKKQEQEWLAKQTETKQTWLRAKKFALRYLLKQFIAECHNIIWRMVLLSWLQLQNLKAPIAKIKEKLQQTVLPQNLLSPDVPPPKYTALNCTISSILFLTISFLSIPLQSVYVTRALQSISLLSVLLPNIQLLSILFLHIDTT